MEVDAGVWGILKLRRCAGAGAQAGSGGFGVEWDLGRGDRSGIGARVGHWIAGSCGGWGRGRRIRGDEAGARIIGDERGFCGCGRGRGSVAGFNGGDVSEDDRGGVRIPRDNAILPHFDPFIPDCVFWCAGFV